MILVFLELKDPVLQRFFLALLGFTYESEETRLPINYSIKNNALDKLWLHEKLRRWECLGNSQSERDLILPR